MRETLEYIENNLEKIRKIVLSSPRGNVEIARVSIRKLDDGFQAEEFCGNKVFHKNIGKNAFVEWLRGYGIDVFRQHAVYSAEETATFLCSKHGKVTKTLSAGVDINVTAHNKEKNYLIPEGVNVPILYDLGVFTAQNKVSHQMYDKYRQINRFIEIVEDVLKGEDCKALNIVDFGCGKSYLTFVLYHYLTFIRKTKVRITGYDLKSDVVDKSNELAKKYGYENIEFICGDISKVALTNVDIMVALHACDTATDYALFNAIASGARHIFCAPCCQHELNSQIKGEEIKALLRHGILKERFSALLTDAVRGEILEACGYKTQILEFVDLEQTAKNILIRASLKKKKTCDAELDEIESLLNRYGCEHTLLKLVKNYLIVGI